MQNEAVIQNPTTTHSWFQRRELRPIQAPRLCGSSVKNTAPAVQTRRCPTASVVAPQAQADRFAVDPAASQLATIRLGYRLFILLMIGLNATVWSAFLVNAWLGAGAFFAAAMIATVYGFNRTRD